ncbi:MAG TPA: SPFH domain-containing protein [Prolixibacteraceae bacterium]|nr:SPFH domain-containing protein [Bacteroidales bacterium]HOY51523.1 SPFH domain-containing protein [Prolixibacteraceae bacterium]HPJ78510.1 SPFH domain-containing protein [Prolixibacteraceae bacterium]HRV89685.1 SPFH domain-containing protein [Prolixibacteraceae bacterium]
MEKRFSPLSGYLFVVIELVLLAATIMAGIRGMVIPGVVSGVVFLFLSFGFQIVNPNESAVLVLFGAYKGSIKENGFYWVNPFLSRRKISLRARNFDSEPLKVNDKIGNPIMIGVVLVWRVKETFKAAFQVDDYEHFVNIQTEAAIRKLAGLYPYDNFEDHDAVVTLRSGGEEVNEQLEKELGERLEIAGVEVMEARINYLAYAQEIAQAMLKRQQAAAIVAARFKIVEGAVSMVEMALEELSKKDIVQLDEDKKASMVSNLMVVLCGDKETTPIVNTGTIY